MKRTFLQKLWLLAVMIYFPFTNGGIVYAQALKWTTKASVPLTTPSAIGGRSAMCFAINGKIYVGGGYIASLTNSREFYEYDTTTNVWTQKADLPGVLNRSAGVGFAINGKGYMGLGAEFFLDISGGQIDLADMWEYNPATDVWVAKAPMPDSGKVGAGCFVINNKAYIVGGGSNKLWEFDPAADTWAPKAPFPLGAIEDPFAFTLGTGSSARGYVSCGIVAGANSKKTYAYDPVANSWTAKNDYPGSAVRGGVAFTMNNKAYCGMAGLSYTVYTDTFYAYNAVLGSWGSAITNFPAQPRGYGIAASFGNKAFLGAGWTYTIGTGETFYRDWYRVVDTSATTTSIETQTNGNGIKVFPNPAQKELYIDIANTSIITGEIALFNLVGRATYATNWNKGIPVNIGSLPAGQYVVRLVTEQGVFYEKIMITE